MYDRGTRAYNNENYRYALKCLLTAQKIYQHLGEEKRCVWTSLSATYEQLGRFGEARECLEKCLDRVEEGGKWTLDTISILGDLARLYLEEEQYEEAEGVFLDALESCFEFDAANSTELDKCQNLTVQLYEEKARLHCKLGQCKQEVHCWKEVIKYRPGQEQLVALAEAYYYSGKIDKSFVVCEQIALNYPDNVEMLLLQARISCDQEKYDQAYQLCEKVLLHRPKCNSLKSSVLFIQAQCMVKDQKTHEKAESLFRKSLRSKPTIECYNELANLLCVQRRFQEALVEANQAHRIAEKERDQRLVLVTHTLGEISFQMGKYEDALHWFKEVRKLNIEFEEIDERIEKVKSILHESDNANSKSTSNPDQLAQTNSAPGCSPVKEEETKDYKLSAALPSSMTSWTIDHVAQFLRFNKFEQFEQQFKFHKIDGKALAHLNENHMMSHLGIQHLGEALTLKQLIEDWKESKQNVTIDLTDC